MKYSHSQETKGKIRQALLGRKNQPHSLETRLKMSKSAMGNKNAVGIIPSEETRNKIRLTKLGNKNPNYGKPTWNLGLKMSEESRRKLSESKKQNFIASGRVHKQSPDERARQSRELKEWRFSVFKRDGFRCLDCGEIKSGQLNADHIYPFAYYPRLRYDINNGRTLCVECHKKTPTYGSKVKLLKPQSISPVFNLL